jgi:dTMP kinase
VRPVSRPSYIALEGAEGCGKSTQAAALASDLEAVLTRETGGTAIGLRIREILHDVASSGLAPTAEALLTAADRAQHIAEIVAPELADGRHVVSDRSVYSALAYQGYGRMLDVEEVRRINDWAIGSRWPDLVVLIEVEAAELALRMEGRELDRFEQEDGAFHERVLDGFRAMAAADPAHWTVVDGNGTVDEVQAAVREAVRQHLGL